MVLLISIPFISICVHLPRWLSGKESACQSRRLKKCRFNPWVRKIPWSRKLQPTRILLPEKFHGQLTVCSPWGHKESDMNECTWVCVHARARAHTHTHTHTHTNYACTTQLGYLSFRGCFISISGLVSFIILFKKLSWLFFRMNLPSSGNREPTYFRR